MLETSSFPRSGNSGAAQQSMTSAILSLALPFRVCQQTSRTTRKWKKSISLFTLLHLETIQATFKKASMYHLASFVIDCIIKKSCKEKEINDLLIIANGLNFFKPKSCTSFSLIKDNIDCNDYKKTIIHSLRAIEAHVGDQVEETRQVCFRYTIVVCRFFWKSWILDWQLL